MHIVSHCLIEVASPEVLYGRTAKFIAGPYIEVYETSHKDQGKNWHDKE